MPINTQRIVVSPYIVYMAPGGVPIPKLADGFRRPTDTVDIDDIAALNSGEQGKFGGKGVDWTVLGGVLISDEGVTINHAQTVNKIRSGAVAAPLKAHRTEEDLMAEFMVQDVGVDNYARVLDQVIRTTPAVNMNPTGVADITVPGYRSIGFDRGTEVDQHSLIVRGFSPDASMVRAGTPAAAGKKLGTPTVGNDIDAKVGDFLAVPAPDAPHETLGSRQAVVQVATITNQGKVATVTVVDPGFGYGDGPVLVGGTTSAKQVSFTTVAAFAAPLRRARAQYELSYASLEGENPVRYSKMGAATMSYKFSSYWDVGGNTRLGNLRVETN